MMTPKEKGCNAWIEKNSRGISAEVGAMPIGVGSGYIWAVPTLTGAENQ